MTPRPFTDRDTSGFGDLEGTASFSFTTSRQLPTDMFVQLRVQQGIFLFLSQGENANSGRHWAGTLPDMSDDLGREEMGTDELVQNIDQESWHEGIHGDNKRAHQKKRGK